MVILNAIDDGTNSWDWDAKPDLIEEDEDIILPDGERISTVEEDILAPSGIEELPGVESGVAYY